MDVHEQESQDKQDALPVAQPVVNPNLRCWTNWYSCWTNIGSGTEIIRNVGDYSKLEDEIELELENLLGISSRRPLAQPANPVVENPPTDQVEPEGENEITLVSEPEEENNNPDNTNSTLTINE